jgi:hypothetical protein
MPLCAAAVQVDNKSSTPVEVVEMKLHQRLHLTGESFLQNKIIDVVRVAIRCDPALGALLTTQWLLSVQPRPNLVGQSCFAHPQLP